MEERRKQKKRRFLHVSVDDVSRRGDVEMMFGSAALWCDFCFQYILKLFSLFRRLFFVKITNHCMYT